MLNRGLSKNIQISIITIVPQISRAVGDDMRVKAGQSQGRDRTAFGRAGLQHLCHSLGLCRALSKSLVHHGNPLGRIRESCGEIFLGRGQVDVAPSPHLHRLEDTLADTVLRGVEAPGLPLLQPRLAEVCEALREDLIVDHFRVIATRLWVLGSKKRDPYSQHMLYPLAPLRIITHYVERGWPIAVLCGYSMRGGRLRES